MHSTLVRSTALIMACLSSVGFDSVGYGQTLNQQRGVTKVAPRPLPPAEQKSDRSRWKTLALKLSGNPYLPPKFQPHLTEEQKRKDIATFYRLWSIRSRILSGPVANEERSFYYKNLSKDIRYRLAVLEALKGSLGNSAADISRKGRLSRTIKHLGSLADVYSRQESQRVSAPPAASSPTRSTCYVSTWGTIICVDEDRLASGLMTGYWVGNTTWRTTDFEYARAYDLLHSLNSIWTNVGAGTEAANTLVLCGTGSVFAVETLGELKVPGGQVDSPTLPPSQPSTPEMFGMLAGCSIGGASSGGIVRGGIGGGGVGGQSDPFSELAKAIAQCNETGDPGAGMQGLTGDPIFGGANLAVSPIYGAVVGTISLVVGTSSLAISIYVNFIRPRSEAQKAEFEASVAERAATSARTEASKAQQEANDAGEAAAKAVAAANEAANKANDALAQASANPTPENMKAAEAAAAEARAAQAAADKAKAAQTEKEAAAKAADDAAKEAEAKAKKAREEAKKKKAAAGLSSTESSFNFEPGTSSTCSSLQGALNKLKMQCSTQTASFCNLLSRRSSLCANSTVIYPDPEAGNPCVQAASPVFDVCEKTKQVMGGLESPVEDSPIRCTEGLNKDNLYAQAEALRDPCKNPAMMPNPEKPCGGSVGSIPGNVSGGPIPKLSTSGNVIDLPNLRIVDGLGLRFFTPPKAGHPTGAGKDR